MATDKEIREWLTGQGETVTARGNLRKEQRDQYAAAHTDDAGVTEADPGPVSDRYADPAPDMAESVPRSPRTRPTAGRQAAGLAKSAESRARQIWGKARDAGKPKRGEKKRPWISTATVIEHFWSQAAWAARPLPPVAKILAAQAPTSGILLEEAARDTFIDRVVLQPAARLEDRLQAANAMLGPPLWTAAIALTGGAKQDPATGAPLVVTEDGRTMTLPAAVAANQPAEYLWDDRTRVMIGGLRFSIMSWLKVGEKRAEEIIESARELSDLGDQADQLIAWILAPVQAGQSPKEAEREAQEMGAAFIARKPPPGRAAEQATGPAGASQDDITAHLEGMAAGSALRPAPAGKP